jgi:hypothetical protein
MKPDCPNCQTGICYHIHDSRRIEVQEVKDRIELLELAVEILEERLSTLMDTQYIEPYTIELSDEDAEKLKKFATDRYYLPERFRDISNGE